MIIIQWFISATANLPGFFPRTKEHCVLYFYPKLAFFLLENCVRITNSKVILSNDFISVIADAKISIVLTEQCCCYPVIVCNSHIRARQQDRCIQ